MANTYFQFKQFLINQKKSGMKVTTDACLFGAWVANQTQSLESKSILDIGTGTGLLSLMLAQVTHNSEIEALEINENAYSEAIENFNHSPWSKRLTAIHTSLQEYKSDKKYDIIICNPPFFLENQKGINFNKNQAIHADSLSKRDLVTGISKLLAPLGKVFILLPEREMLDFIQIAKEFKICCHQQVIVRNKKQGEVFRTMAGFSFLENKIVQNEMIIRDESDQYSSEFLKLLHPYYL